MVAEPLSIDLPGLIAELRARDFAVSVDQCLAAEKVLLALAAERTWPEQAATWLAPVFATSPQTQAEFYQAFNEWAALQSVPVGEAPMGLRAAESPQVVSVDVAQRRRKLPSWRAVAAVGGIAVVALGLAAYLAVRRQFVQQSITGQVLDAGNRAVAGASIAFKKHRTATDGSGNFTVPYREADLPEYIGVRHPDYPPKAERVDKTNQHRPFTIQLGPAYSRPPSVPDQTTTAGRYEPLPPPPLAPATQIMVHYVPVARIVAALLPVALLGAWWLWRYLPRLYLGRFGAKRQPRVESIRVAEGSDRAVQSGPFRRVAQSLHRRRDSETRGVEVERTIEATIRHGGWFTPVMARRKLLPEYLVLIDRLSLRDQQARFGDELTRALQRSGVFIRRYYFRGEPRVCEDETNRRVTPEELAAAYPGHYLLIFGNASAFFDAITGSPLQWVQHIETWADRALLAADLRGSLAPEHEALSRRGFMVLPATLAALARIGGESLPGSSASVMYPRLLLQDPARWVDSLPPEDSLVNRLLVQLERYLGEDGFAWLCACAVYPELHWDLTLYFGYAVCGRETVEAHLADLVQLPWFRHGDMPQWLRGGLIAGMGAESERRTRIALESLLSRIIEQGGFELEIAAEGRGEHVLSRWQRLLLMNYVKTEPPSSRLRDYVFLSFLSRREPKRLVVEAPRALRTLLFRRGARVLGRRPGLGWAAAMLSGAGLWWGVGKMPAVQAIDPMSVRLTTFVPPVIGLAPKGSAPPPVVRQPGPQVYPATDLAVGVFLLGPDATITRAGMETAIAARPGDFLFAGDRLEAQTGLSILYCPLNIIGSLRGPVVIGANTFKSPDEGIVRSVRFCRMPPISRVSRLAYVIPEFQGTAGQQQASPPAQVKDPAALLGKVPEAQYRQIAAMTSAISKDANDVTALMSRGATLQANGLVSEAVADYRALYSRWRSPQLAGLIVELESSRSVQASGAAPAKHFALVIGISKYQRVAPLKYADTDAQTFAAFLRTPRGGAVQAQNLVVLVDEAATTAAIRNNLYGIMASAGPQDTVTIYFAGHIMSGTRLLTFVTSNSDPQDLEATALPAGIVGSALAGARARRITLYIDAPNLKITDVMDAISGSTRALTLAPCSAADRKSEPGKNGHSAFTYLLLNGLNGAADTDADGRVVLAELVRYLQVALPKETTSRQRLCYNSGGASDDLVLSNLAGPGIARE